MNSRPLTNIPPLLGKRERMTVLRGKQYVITFYKTTPHPLPRPSHKLPSSSSSHSNCCFRECVHGKGCSALLLNFVVYVVLEVAKASVNFVHRRSSQIIYPVYVRCPLGVYIMWKLFSSVTEWIGNSLYFSKATLCIRGLVFSRSFVGRAVSSILIMYLVLHILKNYEMAAVLINLVDGAASVMVIVLAFLSHKIGHYRMVVFASFSYTLALALLWISAQFIRQGADAVDNFFYWAAVLLAIGGAGMNAVIPKLLDHQYTSEQGIRGHESEEEKERLQSCKDALWRHPWFFGAVATLFIPGDAHWKTVFLISMIAMGVSLILMFWFGKSFHPPSSSGETAPREKFGVTLKENGHRYVEMLAMSLAFVAYSLVEATGSTFFLEQTTFLDNHIGKFTVPVVYLTVLQTFSRFIISHLLGLLIPKQRRNVALVKIGCGLVLSVLCCVIAWRIEILRSSKIKVVLDDNTPIISMSILWLLPQFSLLGLMRGLAKDGLVEFFAEQVVDDDKEVVRRYYGPHAFSFVLGIGSLLTAVSILVFRRTWLDDDVHKNRLDKYYRGLVFLGVANLGYYLCIALYFYIKHGPQTNDEETANKGEI